MKIKLEEKEGVKVITLEGKIMGAPEDDVFINTVYEFADQKNINVVVELSGVDWMNSRGLGMCLRALSTLRNRGGDLRLANLSKNAQSLMEKCRLLSVFKHFKTVEKAVESFK